MKLAFWMAFPFLLVAMIMLIVIPAQLSQPNNGWWTTQTTGVHVTHAGQPVRELFVEVLCGNCLSPSVEISGTTDSQGYYTFRPGIAQNTAYLYRVTFNGQTYGILGSSGQIVDDPL